MQEDQVHGADGAVALFGDDQLGEAAEIFAVAIVDFFAEDEADHIGVLLDRARFAKVAELRAVIALAGFDARLNCESTIIGTLSSFASSFMPRERALTSWLRFSKRPRPLISCR